MSEWNPETGTHYQQRITLGEIEQKQYGLNYPVGTHYPNLSILDYFKGETFKKYKMDYCNTCIKIVQERTKRKLKSSMYLVYIGLSSCVDLKAF